MKGKNGIVDFLKSSTGRIILIIVLYVVIFGIEFILLETFNDSSTIFIIIAIAMAYFGWQALSKITPNLFLIMPLGHWFWYWGIKGFLSIFIGAIVAPYQIAKMIIKKI